MNPDAKVVYKLFGKISRHEDEGFEMLDSCPVWTQLWDATDGDVKAMLAKATPRQLAAMKNELTEVIEELFESKDEVKEDEEDDGGFEAIQSAIIRRIAHSHHELLMKLGPDGVLEAAREVAEFAAPVEEIGSSDVSGWVRQIERDAGIEQEDSDLHEAFNRALGESYDTRDAYELDDPKHPDFVKNYEEYKSKHPDAKLADFIAFLRSRKNESVAGDDHVNKDVKMKRMGAKELGIADKFKIMPSQMQAMKKGDSENDLLHYNKLQAKNTVAEMLKLAGLK
jgi:hypothetical protein